MSSGFFLPFFGRDKDFHFSTILLNKSIQCKDIEKVKNKIKYSNIKCVLSHFSHVLLCDHMDYSHTGSSVHGIFQARILEWVAVPSSRGSSRPRDQIQVSVSSALACGFFTTWKVVKSTTWEAPKQNR